MHTTNYDQAWSDNLRIVQTAFQATLRGDWTALSEVAHPDLAIQIAQALPYGGIYRGSEAQAQAQAGFAQTWGSPQVKVEQFMCGEDRVSILLNLVARHRVSGKLYSTMIVEIWKLRDGQVVEILPFYWDTAAINALDRAGQYIREPSN